MTFLQIYRSQPAESTPIPPRPQQHRVFQIAFGILRAISTDNISLLAAEAAFILCAKQGIVILDMPIIDDVFFPRHRLA